MTVSDLLEQLVTGLIMASSLLQDVNNLFQTCYNKSGTSSANTTCWQLVNRLVTTCLQTCNNLCVFTRVVVFALLVTSCQQVWNKLLTTCSKLVDVVRLVTRLFQQGCYNHDITILLQLCLVNLVTSCCIITVSDVTTCNRSDNAINLLQVVSNLFLTCCNKSGTSSVVDNLWTDLLQLVCRLVTTCAFLRVYWANSIMVF